MLALHMSAFGGKADMVAVSLRGVAHCAGRASRALPECLQPHRTHIQICVRSSAVQSEPRGRATSVHRTKGSAGGRRQTPLRSRQCGAWHAPITRREGARSTIKLANQVRVPSVCVQGQSGHRAVAAEWLLLTPAMPFFRCHSLADLEEIDSFRFGTGCCGVSALRF